MTCGRGYADVVHSDTHTYTHACMHKSRCTRSVFSIEHECSNWILDFITCILTSTVGINITVCAWQFYCAWVVIFSLYAKSWRGAGSRRDCHRAPKLQAQMWSSVRKVTPSCNLMESQRKKRTWPARALAKKSLLKNKTCRRRCVYNTNYCGESVFLPETLLALNLWQKT